MGEHHHIHQLRWQAGAGDAAAAIALREQLLANSERVTRSLSRALDGLGPGDGRTVHLRRLVLRLAPDWLAGSDELLDSHVAAAVEQAWRHLPGSAVESFSATDLPGFLETGHLPPGLSAHDRVTRLREAAMALPDPIRQGTRVGSFHQRVGWFRRWLALWPAAERRQWVQRRLTHPPAAASVPAQLAERLERLMLDERLPARRQVLAQAVWLAATSPAPLALDPQRRARDEAMLDRAMSRWIQRMEAPWLTAAASAGAGAPPPAARSEAQSPAGLRARPGPAGGPAGDGSA